MVNPVQAGGTKLRILCGMVGLPKRHITGTINKSLFFDVRRTGFFIYDFITKKKLWKTFVKEIFQIWKKFFILSLKFNFQSYYGRKI